MPVVLNVDAGELEAEPHELIALADLVHVACGGHAGDARTMERTVRRALGARTALGAHPSYPDREGFGRRAIAITRADLVRSIDVQCRQLAEVARSVGAALTSAKPHGALYHDGANDAGLALDVTRAIVNALGPVSLVGPDGSGWQGAAREHGVAFLREGFADRGIAADGKLVPRGASGALLTDRIAIEAQTARLVRSGAVDTICVHGDGADAVGVLYAVRAELDRART